MSATVRVHWPFTHPPPLDDPGAEARSAMGRVQCCGCRSWTALDYRKCYQCSHDFCTLCSAYNQYGEFMGNLFVLHPTHESHVIAPIPEPIEIRLPPWDEVLMSMDSKDIPMEDPGWESRARVARTICCQCPEKVPPNDQVCPFCYHGLCNQCRAYNEFAEFLGTIIVTSPLETYFPLDSIATVLPPWEQALQQIQMKLLELRERARVEQEKQHEANLLEEARQDWERVRNALAVEEDEDFEQ